MDGGKIYILRSLGSGKFYVGSTFRTLNERLSAHKNEYKQYIANKHNYVSSFDVMRRNDVVIELYENYACENKADLKRREGVLIREFRQSYLREFLVNRNIAGRTSEEWNAENVDKQKEYQKRYYQEHKAFISVQRKLYYENKKFMMNPE